LSKQDSISEVLYVTFCWAAKISVKSACAISGVCERSVSQWYIFLCEKCAIVHICYYPPVRPSVRPSVCLSVTWVDQPKTVELRITQFSRYGSLVPLLFRGKFHPEILMGSPEWGCQTRVGWGKQTIF